MYPTVTINGVTIQDLRGLSPFWIQIAQNGDYKYIIISTHNRDLIINGVGRYLSTDEAKQYSDELLHAIDTIEQIYQHFEKIGKPL